MNPLVPGVADAVLAVAATVNLALVIIALVSLARSADRRHRVLLALVIVLVPFVGPIACLAAAARLSSRADSSKLERMKTFNAPQPTR